MITETVALITAGLAFAASLVAGGVSIYNARFGRFAQQRWWDRKVDAYSRIIEALSGLAHYYEEHMNAELEGREISDARQKDIKQFWSNGYAEVKRATAVGAFLISTESEAALQKMWREKGKGVQPGDWYAQMESDYTATSDCLKSIVAAARSDLGIH